MIELDQLIKAMAGTGLEAWSKQLPAQIEARMDSGRYGDLPKWKRALAALPEVSPSRIELDADAVTIGEASDISPTEHVVLKDTLMGLHPWRKGPFELFGLPIDTEWHSDWKWNRLRNAITPLQGRRVLDVGCGNGYYALRMAGAGAERVIGIDPTPVFVMQFQAFRRYLPNAPVDVLPLALEDLPERLEAFDTVFSMGVLYHRRSPLDHILALRDCLSPGGELVLETLVIEGDEHAVLMPEGRYAKMRNTWFIPSVAMLEIWLRRCGFRSIRVVDVNQTTVEEQRSTEWMHFESLADFLDPSDSNQTVEGYPAPRRAVLIAEKP
jgi:tRNA (mo5U34)-methyltransferase